MRKSVSWLLALALVTMVVVIVGLVHIRDRVAAGRAPVPAGVVLAGLGPTPTAGGATVRVAFASVPDGPLPARLDDRFFRTVESGRNDTPAAVAHGGFTHGDPTGPDAASFAETTLGNPVHRLGVTARFAANLGDIALVAWQSPLAGAAAQGRMPNAGIHFVASAVQWHLSVFSAAVQREIVLASGPYTGRLGDPQSFEVSRTGDTATVHLPDGTERTVSDPRIASWSADDACWELYEYRPGEHPAVITALWAD